MSDKAVHIILSAASVFFFAFAIVSMLMGSKDYDLLIIGLIFQLMDGLFSIMQRQSSRVKVSFIGVNGKEVGTTVLCKDCAEKLKALYDEKGGIHER